LYRGCQKNVPLFKHFFATNTYAAVLISEHKYDKRYKYPENLILGFFSSSSSLVRLRRMCNWDLPFDVAQGGESFDVAQHREPVERPVEPFVICDLFFVIWMSCPILDPEQFLQ
jgi:hypothetical protein